ncbi:MAG: Methylmalonyl-CoA mutase [Methanobacteriota archaeon]|nr:MAG: Methylmalonyl-CoA mutase [Euryarchaeota archaeon]
MAEQEDSGTKEIRKTLGGLEIPHVATEKWAMEMGYVNANLLPGFAPYTRGIHEKMYRGKIWTMRQYAGFSSAKETNIRFKMLLELGQKGLSVAFDLPTQLGLDSTNRMSEGEVGKVGVAIDTIEDMKILFKDIPLDHVSTSMTINSPAMILLAMYIVCAEEMGVESSKLRGTIQNDILKEYIARGTHIFPPEPSLRLITDIFEYCANNLPNWNTISVSGYHIREAGSTAVQEVAYTLANGLEYIDAAIERGLKIDDFAPQISFFFNCHNDFFEEISKFRAARKLWYDLINENYSPKNPKSSILRFHTQVAGVSLTAQQPQNNISRVTIQALASVCGGTQSLHTNSFDEAIGLPTEKSATIALRTQQIIAEESGAANVADPLGGSYLVEGLTSKIYNSARDEINKINEYGGSLKAIESGYQQRKIHEAAFEFQKEIESGHRKIVGVNYAITEEDEPSLVQSIDSGLRELQSINIEKIMNDRNNDLCFELLNDIKNICNTNVNVFPKVIEAVRARCTIGEIVDAMREVFGNYRPPSGF